MSNVTIEELQRAEAIVPVVAAQERISPNHHPHETFELVDACEERSIPFLAWGPLWGITHGEPAEARPRFEEVADEVGATVHQVALAWVRSFSPAIVTLSGPTSPVEVAEGLRSTELDLPADVLGSLPGRRHPDRMS